MINQIDISLDWFLRMASMALLLVFFTFSLRLSKKAKDAEIDVKKNYFLSFSLFFLLFFINFLYTELSQIMKILPSPTLLNGSIFFLFMTTTDETIWMFFFFFLGATPLSFAIERYLLMHKKVPITIISLIAVILNTMVFLFPLDIIPTNVENGIGFVTAVYDWLAIVVVVLTLLILYLRIAIISTGSLRAVGFLMFFGFIFNVVGVILTSDNSEIGHAISLVGFILIFISIIQMK